MLVVFDNDFERSLFTEVDNKSKFYGDFSFLVEDPFKSAKFIVASPDVPFRAVSIEVANYLVDLQKREEYK